MKRTAVSSSSTSRSNKKRCTDESASDPVSSSVKKWSGAAIYKSKFQESWKQRWPFIAAVPDNVSQFYCNVCSKKLSCGHQGETDVKRHIESATHTSNSNELKTNCKLTSLLQPEKKVLKDKVSIHFVLPCNMMLFLLGNKS